MIELISRRLALKGLGVSVALPWLEGMAPSLSVAASTAPSAAAAPPRRMAFCYVPNGVNIPQWAPRTVGASYELTATLEPLRAFKADFNVLSGLTCDKARPHGDGGGDHARAMSAFLTGCQARKTHGADLRSGVSADQAAALRIGSATRFASLEIGCEAGGLSGNCDSGYSCAYSHAISWRTPNTPIPKEVNPRAVFDRLFAGPQTAAAAQAQARRDRYNLSILDFVAEDTRQLQGRLGSGDQRRLDEYLTGLREVEQRLARASRDNATTLPAGATRPSGIPRDYGEHLRLMADILVLAFRADLTRIATFVFANEGSNRNYRLIEVPDGHHDLSHHQNDRAKLDKIARINRFHVEQFAYLVRKLKDVTEGEGTLLDNCMVAYGSGNSDGNRHNHDDLPILLAGRGGRSITTGRHVRYPRETPVTNLWLAMLDRMGAPTERLGDSTGILGNLA